MLNEYIICRREDDSPYLQVTKEIDLDTNKLTDINYLELFKTVYHMDVLDCERSYILAMDRDGHAKGILQISVGDNTTCYVYPRTVAMFMFLLGAEKFFVLHNHPNGMIIQSNEDIMVNATIKSMAYTLGFNMIGDFVVGRHGWSDINDDEVIEWGVFV